jgi:hypothetical protein
MKTFLLAITVLLLTLSGLKPQACTIFCIANDSVVLAGNNEDWSDPLTRFWIIPPEDGRNGWIKFGFDGGFPQGGMNEHGLFWDATAGPYLEMPISEATKQKYPGVIMQKIIEECSNLVEAREVFSLYYTDDQYSAQYIVADSSGKSMIVEGDNIIGKSGNYQVLTNFYQSHPELGGFPCWRFNTACDILDTCSTILKYPLVYALSATHQEGKYPTQYSVLYDLVNQEILLFHYHNFDEHLLIGLEEEFIKGPRSYRIGNLFSKMKLMTPSDGESLGGEVVVFRWKGRESSNYEVLISESPDFENYQIVEVNGYLQGNKFVSAGLSIWIIPALLLLSFLVMKRGLVILLLISISLTSIHCKKDDTEVVADDTKEFTVSIESLQQGKTYYWRIRSQTSMSDEFRTYSVTRSFHFQ